MDLDKLTNEQMLKLLGELLEQLPEADVLTVIRDWVKDHGLEGELD